MADLTHTTPNQGKHQILHELEIWPESSRWLADFGPNSAKISSCDNRLPHISESVKRAKAAVPKFTTSICPIRGDYEQSSHPCLARNR